MPIPFAGVFIYLGCGLLLWFTVYIIAPVGYNASLGRATGAAFLMALANAAVTALLQPALGWWCLLVLFVVFVVVVKVFLWLSFWRSLLAATVYFISLVMVSYLLSPGPKASPRGSNHPAATNPAMTARCHAEGRLRRVVDRNRWATE